jgi:two-component sensor histidine kinase/PAS domain-containing protein
MLAWYGGCALLLTGIGLCVGSIRSGLAVAAGALVGGLGLVLLGQLVGGTDLGIQGVFTGGGFAPRSIPGDPTAVTLPVLMIVTGAALVLSHRREQWSCFGVGILGAAVSAAGLIGVLLGLVGAVTGTAAPQILPLLAAPGFLLAGAALVSHAWSGRDLSGQRLAGWATALVAAAAGTASVCVWQAVVHAEHRALEVRLQSAAEHLATTIARELEMQVSDLQRTARRWQGTGLSYRSPAEPDGVPFLSKDGAYGVGWRDSASRIRWMVPADAMRALAALKTASLWSETSRNGTQDLRASFSRIFNLPKGGSAFLVSVPVSAGSEADGAVIGLVSVQDMLAASARRTGVGDLDVSLLAGETEIGHLTSASTVSVGGPIAESAFPQGGFLWRLRLRSTEDWIGRAQTSLPLAVLSLGALLTLLLSLLVHQTLRYYYRLEEATAGSAELATEIDTARREQALLRATEFRFRASIDGMPEGFGIFRAIRSSREDLQDFRIDYLNGAGAAALNITDADVTGRRLSELVPGYLSSPMFRDHQSVVDTGEAVVKEIKVASPNGPPGGLRSLLVRYTRLSDGLAAVWLDTTERKKVEEAQRELETRYRAFFEGVPVALYRTSATGEILEANPALVNLLRFPDLGTLRTFNTSAFFIDPAMRAREQDMLTASGVVRGFEMRVMCYDSSIRWLRDTCHAVRDQQGQVLYYEGMLEDITEQKLADEQLHKSLAEKELLLKEVHHRVKNNLQVISSLLSLQSSATSDRKALEMFMESQDRVRSMAMVHERLYQSPDLASIDFSEYVQSLVSHLCRVYASAARPVNVQVDIRTSSLGVDEAISCGLIINELVSNSLKHAFPEGRSGAVWVRLDSKPDRFLVLTVGDDGVGLPVGFSIEEAETLGLQLVKTLAEQLDGSIDITTVKGAEFRVTFPQPANVA